MKKERYDRSLVSTISTLVSSFFREMARRWCFAWSCFPLIFCGRIFQISSRRGTFSDAKEEFCQNPMLISLRVLAVELSRTYEQSSLGLASGLDRTCYTFSLRTSVTMQARSGRFTTLRLLWLAIIKILHTHHFHGIFSVCVQA